MRSCNVRKPEGIVRKGEIVRRIATGALGLTLLVVAVAAATTVGDDTAHARPNVVHRGDVARGNLPSGARPSGDVLRDSSLVIGTLPNGLRYYLRANRAPAHRVELRLAVNAGSVLEDNDQR